MMPEMFAVDIHIFLDGQDTNSLKKVMQITKDFSSLSGLQLSASKTEILGINEAQVMMNEANRLQLKIVDKIKFVGAFVTKKQGKQENVANFEKAFSQINSGYKAWKWRHPSPLGATVIIKSLMTSTLTHLLVNFYPENQPLVDYTVRMKLSNYCSCFDLLLYCQGITLFGLLDIYILLFTYGLCILYCYVPVYNLVLL
jgi:hypothetical protein